jgi:hypothetical protein
MDNSIPLVLNARLWNVFFILMAGPYPACGFAVLRGSCIGKTALVRDSTVLRPRVHAGLRTGFSGYPPFRAGLLIDMEFNLFVMGFNRLARFFKHDHSIRAVSGPGLLLWMMTAEDLGEVLSGLKSWPLLCLGPARLRAGYFKN